MLSVRKMSLAHDVMMYDYIFGAWISMSSVCLLQLLHLNALFYYFTILNFQSNKVLEFERCDLDIKSNKRSHHTEQNGEDRLIVRRGQPFSLVLHLKAGSPEFNPEETSFTLIVETGIVHCVVLHNCGACEHV